MAPSSARLASHAVSTCKAFRNWFASCPEVSSRPRWHAILQSALVASLLGFSLLPAAGQTVLVSDLSSNTIQSLDVATSTYTTFITGVVGAQALTIGPDGNVYVADLNNNSVLKYTSMGALIGVFVAPNSGGLSAPTSLVFGADGNLYVASQGPPSSGAVIKYNGSTGALIGNFATRLAIPEDLTFGPDGNLYVADYLSGDVYKFNGTTGALISTFATGALATQGLAFSPLNGNLYVSDPGGGAINIYNGTTGAFISSFGTASGAWGPHFDTAGNLFYADPGNNQLVEIDTANAVHYFPLANSNFRLPCVVSPAPPSTANVLVSDLSSNTIQSLDVATSTYTTFITGVAGAQAVTIGPDGNVYVADLNNSSVSKYTSMGAFIGVFVAADSGGLSAPTSLVFGADGNLYVASQGPPSSGAVIKYDGTTGALIGNFATLLAIPEDLTFGPDGNLYVADYLSGDVYKFNGTTGALISTFATGAPATQGLAFSPLNGYLYVSDPGGGAINIYNGTTGAFISSFGTASGAWGPHFDTAGNLFYADPGNNRLVEIDTANAVHYFPLASSNFRLPYVKIAAPSISCSATNSGEVSVAFSSQVTASGGLKPYTFSVATGSLPNGLTLSASTGAITGTPTAAGTFTVQVKDAEGSVATATCPYTIIAGPSISCSATNAGEVSVPFSSQVSASGGATPYTYSVATGSLPNGLTLSASTGAITGTPTAAGTFTVQVEDAAGVVATSTCPYTIIAGPSISCSATNAGEVSVPFSSQVSASGGTLPYTFSVASGSLPNGLTLNASTGAITGTPTSFGSFTMKVTDALGVVATSTCPYTVYGGLSLSCSLTNSGEVGAAFSSQVTASGGTLPYTYSVASGSLPNGLALNASTGAITGTPTAAGTFTVQVKDALGVVATSTCPYTIIAGPSINCSATNSGEVGAAFSSQVTASGGTLPYTYSVASGSLPNGLALNASTGAITGTPTAAGSFTVQVKDADGVVATGTCPYTINQTPKFTSANNATFQTGVSGSFPVTATGIPAVTSFTETGKLPSGVTLNMSSGVLSGTPAAGTGGTYPITITASNGVLPNATQSFTLTVNQPAEITGPNYVTFTKGVANSFTVTTTGVPVPALSFSPAGSLPAGVTFVDNHNGTATLSGKPTVTGVFTFWIEASNGVSPAGLESFSLTVKN